MNRTQLKNFNKLWKHLPPGLNDFGREEYILKIAPLFHLTEEVLQDVYQNVVYNKEKDKFIKRDK